jgi:hypothetical protein
MPVTGLPVFVEADETQPPADPWAMRLIAETRELQDRLARLHAFISGTVPGFSALDVEDRSLLQRQQGAMGLYLLVLQARCAKHGLRATD